jgi:hypothetical protein
LLRRLLRSVVPAHRSEVPRRHRLLLGRLHVGSVPKSAVSGVERRRSR